MTRKCEHGCSGCDDCIDFEEDQMTQQAPAEALQVADLFEKWAKVRGENEAGSHARGARELRRLHARVQELEAALVKEAARTASEKTRADQMSQQHDHQAAMNREARHKLAQLEAVQMPVPDAYLYVNGAHRGVSLEWRSDSDLAEGTERHDLHTGQQVRSMVGTVNQSLTDEQIEQLSIAARMSLTK